MAVTASIAVSAATATAPNGSVVVTCTVTNGNGGVATITGIDPFAVPTGKTNRSTAVAIGAPPLGPGQPNTIQPAGTLAKSWSVTFFAPQTGPGAPTQVVYDVGCIVFTDQAGADAVVTPATTTVTVSAPSHSNL